MFTIEQTQPHQISKYKSTQNIFDTIKLGDIILIKSTLSKYNIDIKIIIDHENNQNAYFFAALIKNDTTALNIFHYLFSLGVNPLFKDKINQTCLYYACREGKLKVCEFLIKQCNLPLNERDIYGQVPIYYAAREGKVDICKLLVDNGADINIEDLYGQNCLFYAVKHGHFDVVKFLVEHGINVNVIDKMNMTVLSLSEKLKDGKIKEFLIQNGSVINVNKIRARNRQTPFNQHGGYNHNLIRKDKEMRAEMTKDELINSIQKQRKYILIRVTQNGEKKPLTSEEIQNLRINYPDVSKLLDDKNTLVEKVKELSKE